MDTSQDPNFQKPPGRRPVRQILHAIVGILFWMLWGGLWVLLFLEEKVTIPGVLAASLTIAVILLAVAVSTWLWIVHNIRIWRSKGERAAPALQAPDLACDRLGRDLIWDLNGGRAQATRTHHILIEHTEGNKSYLVA